MVEYLQHSIFKVISDTADELSITCFVIGGYVRDQIMNRPFKNDIDILVLGSGIGFAEKLGEKLNTKVYVYKRFGTAMLQHDNIQIEVVGARKESYRSDSRKPIVEDGSLKDDQSRRDFTINTLAISLNKKTLGELLDPFDGLKDIELRTIKTPLEPAKTFSDDPLRMMRAVRFATQLNFKIHIDAIEAISDNRERIKIVSKERIIDELNKIILSKTPSIGFKYLYDLGLLEHILPQLHALQGVEYKNGKGHKDNFYHTLEVLDNVAQESDDLWLRWAAIMHDIAKPATKRFDDKVGWTFHGHEDRGAKMVPKIFAELKLPLNDRMRFVQKLVQLHLRPIALVKDIVTDSAIRRLLYDAGEDMDELMLLCQADVTTKNAFKKKKYRENFEKVKQKLKDVEERDKIRNWQPPIDGKDIMNTFKLQPGKEVGEIKNAIREAILEGHISNNRKQAFEYMLEIGKNMGLELTNDQANNEVASH